MTSPDLISGREFYSRLIRKLSHQGVLSGLVKLQRLTDEEQDSMGAMLERRAAETPDRVALLFEDEVYTWGAFNAWANRCANALKDAGIGKGDVVAVMISNRPVFLALTMGVMKLGAISALVNTGLQGEVLAQSLRLAGPKVLVVGEDLVPNIAAVPETQLPAERFVAEEPGPADREATVPPGFRSLRAVTDTASATNPPETANVCFGDVSLYVYTSGTTGMPKCAVTKQRRLFMGGLFVARGMRELKPDDVTYSPLPLYHVTSLLGGWCASLMAGSTLAIARSFSATRFWDDIRKHNATGFNYVGEIARYLWNQPPSPNDRNHRVRSMMGAGLRHEIWPEFKQRFGIEYVYEVYGGSESPSGFMNLLNFDRTCGWMPRGWKVAEWDHEREDIVRDANGRAKALGPGGRGVLLMAIHEHQKFDGYTDPTESQKKVLRDVFKTGDRWFNSGDFVLNQGHGHVRFIDRLGDTFRWHAENVATTQVEGVLNGFPGVLESIVYGVEVPGMEGRAGMARLVFDGTPDLPALAGYLRANLADFAVPRFLRLTSERTDVTGTFRYKKSDLKAEGYTQVGDDDVWLIVPGSEPQPMTDALAADIASGVIRL